MNCGEVVEMDEEEDNQDYMAIASVWIYTIM